MPKQRMKIEDLERLLNSDEEPELEIKPNGEIVRKRGRRKAKPLTMRQDLGGEYGQTL